MKVELNRTDEQIRVRFRGKNKDLRALKDSAYVSMSASLSQDDEAEGEITLYFLGDPDN